MKTLILGLILALFIGPAYAAKGFELIPKPAKVVEVTDVITIESTAFLDDGTVPAIKGYIVGLEGPPMGDYKVKISNCNGFKGKRFTIMNCNLTPYLEEVYDDAQNMGVVSTAFTVNGEVFNVLGFYDCPKVRPSQNYQVVVSNGKNQTLWNTMICRIK